MLKKNYKITAIGVSLSLTLHHFFKDHSIPNYVNRILTLNYDYSLAIERSVKKSYKGWDDDNILEK